MFISLKETFSKHCQWVLHQTRYSEDPRLFQCFQRSTSTSSTLLALFQCFPSALPALPAPSQCSPSALPALSQCSPVLPPLSQHSPNCPSGPSTLPALSQSPRTLPAMQILLFWNNNSSLNSDAFQSVSSVFFFFVKKNLPCSFL